MTDALFLAFLAQHDDGAWHRAVDRLQDAIHPVDRVATRIWFHLFPLRLQRAIDTAPDPAALVNRLRILGRWRLDEQRDTSHTFLYGHRYWAEVCAAVRRFAGTAPGSLDLSAQIQEIARAVATRIGVEASLVVGIAAVAVRTLQQVGFEEATGSGDGTTALVAKGSARDANAVLARRLQDDSQGLFGFLKGDRKQWTVTFDEADPEARFPLMHSQHITTAAALDSRDHRMRDARCAEGPIPVQCRSSSCGTCWVGVLGGSEKLSPMEERERTTIAALGYSEADEARPIIRLSCMAQAFGAVSLVIPPWNGQIGARLRAALAERDA